MKIIVRILSLFILAASIVPALAQQHTGHGYAYSHSSHTSSYSPPRTSQLSRPATRREPVRDTRTQTEISAAREAGARQAAEQRAQSAAAVRERREQRFEQVRRESLSALDEIARTNATRSGTSDAGSTFDQITRANEAARLLGFDCVVSQTGGANCYRQTTMDAPSSYAGQQTIRVPEAYSGSLSAGGYNNPSVQRVNSVGPIPNGTWNATGVAQTLTSSGGQTRPHQNVIHLNPAPGTDALNRTNIRAHGDSTARPGDGSNGCLILPRDVRQDLSGMLRQGGQVRFEVRP